MPKVKQVDFDLNAINNELTGETSDLHREIMPNLIEENPYVFKIVRQPKSAVWKTQQSVLRFKVEAVGIGLTYQWQRRFKNTTAWGIATAAGGKTPVLSYTYSDARNGMDVRCIITDRYGNTLTSNIATLIKGF